MMTTTPTGYQMSCSRWFLTVMLLAAPAVYSVELGDTAEEVKAELGKPTSYIQIGDREVLYFDRGRVEIVEDAVVEVELVSQEEADETKRSRAETKARIEDERREQALARHAEGVNVRERKLLDSNFMLAGATQRVAFWRSFKDRYPSVDVGLEYDEAVRELQLEREVGRQHAQEQARLRDLESRAQEAEVRAARAEKLAYEEAARRDLDRYLAVSRPAVYNTCNNNRSTQPEPEVVHGHHSDAEPEVVHDHHSHAEPAVVFAHPSDVLLRQRIAATKHRNAKVRNRRGYIRPKGVHSAQVHNRALQPPGFPSKTVKQHDESGFGDGSYDSSAYE